MGKQQVGLKLAPEMVAELDAAAQAEGITRTEAVEQALRVWLDAVADPGGVLATLPKAETPKPADPSAPKVAKPKAMAQTKAPPPVRARVHVEVGGPVRPAPGSRLKKR